MLDVWSVLFRAPPPPFPARPMFQPNLPAGGVTWSGCGAHISSVMDVVPTEQWCSCAKPPGSAYPPGLSSRHVRYSSPSSWSACSY